MALSFDSKRGVFVMTASEQTQIDALVRQAGRDGNRDLHTQIGQALRPPIRQIADYREWTNIFFEDWPCGEGEDPRIPVDDYTVVAFYTSADGQVFYTRPGRKYTRIEFTMIDCGLEVGWDDMAEAGWPILQRKMLEAGEEMARKRDAMGLAVLNTAVTSVAGHTDTVAATMTRAKIKTMFQAAAQAGFPISRVAINVGTLMDMSEWVVPAQSFWELPESRKEEMVRQGFVTNWGNALWLAHHSIPAAYVYFGGEPAAIGYRRRKGATRTASDVDIDKKTDKHTWDEKWGFYVGNPYNLWRLTIT